MGVFSALNDEGGCSPERELAKRFESDIYYDAHSLRAKYSRSEARRKLEQLGYSAIPIIVDHLLSPCAMRDSEVRQAWVWLIRDIGKQSARPRTVVSI